MPPKAKVSREEILDKAFELTRKNGYENLTARLLAKELNCSTQPIFHIFENMDHLKAALYEKVRLYFSEVMTKPSTDPDIPLFLSMGLSYLELAQTEKHLFRLLCMSDSFQLNSLYELAGKDIPSLDSKVITKMWIFTHGIASILATNTTVLPKTEIRELLIEVFQDFYHGKPD